MLVATDSEATDKKGWLYINLSVNYFAKWPCHHGLINTHVNIHRLVLYLVIREASYCSQWVVQKPWGQNAENKWWWSAQAYQGSRNTVEAGRKNVRTREWEMCRKKMCFGHDSGSESWSHWKNMVSILWLFAQDLHKADFSSRPEEESIKPHSSSGVYWQLIMVAGEKGGHFLQWYSYWYTAHGPVNNSHPHVCTRDTQKQLIKLSKSDIKRKYESGKDFSGRRDDTEWGKITKIQYIHSWYYQRIVKNLSMKLAVEQLWTLKQFLY